MLDEDGVAGEVAVDDGGLAGVQEAGDTERPERGSCARPGWDGDSDGSSPESRQDLRAPALPGLEQRPELPVRAWHLDRAIPTGQ